jgi:hypothetical protein
VPSGSSTLLCAELGGHRVPQLSLLSGALCLHILVPTEAVHQNRYARGNYEMTYQMLHVFTQISFGLCLIVLTVQRCPSYGLTFQAWK